jgi:hypothetical protein
MQAVEQAVWYVVVTCHNTFNVNEEATLLVLKY